MPRIAFYVSKDLEKKIQRQARLQGKTVPDYLADLVNKQIDRGWRRDFFKKIAGGWKGSFPRVERKPP